MKKKEEEEEEDVDDDDRTYKGELEGVCVYLVECCSFAASGKLYGTWRVEPEIRRNPRRVIGSWARGEADRPRALVPRLARGKEGERVGKNGMWVRDMIDSESRTPRSRSCAISASTSCWSTACCEDCCAAI